MATKKTTAEEADARAAVEQTADRCLELAERQLRPLVDRYRAATALVTGSDAAADLAVDDLVVDICRRAGLGSVVPYSAHETALRDEDAKGFARGRAFGGHGQTSSEVRPVSPYHARILEDQRAEAEALEARAAPHRARR